MERAKINKIHFIAEKYKGKSNLTEGTSHGTCQH